MKALLYTAFVCFEWYRYSIETDCFNRGGRLAVAIMFTTPLALAGLCIIFEFSKYILLKVGGGQ